LDERYESESHTGVLRPTQHEAGEFFEFGGQKLLLKGTSGPPKEPSRIAEGRPIRHDVSRTGRTIESESHSGMLRPTEHQAAEFFEFGGQKLSLKGTSGPPKEPSRIAEGRPIRHDVSLTGRTTPASGTSGPSQVESRVATGRPVQHGPGPQDAVLESTGSGQLIGGPVRRA
jgi:hypothetical protein